MEPLNQPSPSNKGKKNGKTPSPGSTSALRFTDIGIQMCLIIGVGTYLGRRLDDYFLMHTPVFMIVLSLVSTVGAMYIIIKEVSAKD